MNKNITKNIIIGVLGLFLGLSLCYIGYDKLINKENIKEEVNNNQEENKIPTSSDNEESCGNKCYGDLSTTALNAIKWFYNNKKLLDIAHLNGFDNFDIEHEDLENYFSFTISYMMVTNKTIKEEDLKKALLKYFEIKDIDKVIEQLKNYQVKEDNFVTKFEYKDGMFSLEYLSSEYDYNYNIVDYNEDKNAKEISLNIIKCNAYKPTDCRDGKVLTLSNTSDGFKIKKLEKMESY